MEWHPTFSNFPAEKSADRFEKKPKRYPASHDYGVWGTNSGQFDGHASYRSTEGATFWKRTAAPRVVERLPRARSIPNFPGYDPTRDRNYFDAVPEMCQTAQSMSLTDLLPPKSAASSKNLSSVLQEATVGGGRQQRLGSAGSMRSVASSRAGSQAGSYAGSRAGSGRMSQRSASLSHLR
mmetsp:Transcript_6959/g.12664  ORF Transcript_6959/g.12664 Transcript_6959/m.12664 type:complete len:180 (-) Transcript_6959:13-552(-)